MPLISIITTTYNHKDFIWETIQSILDQTFTDRELLIGDDSPGNETRKIIQKYTKKYPEKIKARHHKPNKWIVDNMNFLIENTSIESEYISFLEGDDMYTKNNLKEKFLFFKKHPKINFLHTNYYTKNNKNTNIKKINYKLFKRNLFDILKKWPRIHSFSAVIIKKKILLKYFPFNNLDKKNKNFWPLDCYLRSKILPNTTYWFITKPLFMYRIHENNLSSNSILLINQTIKYLLDIKEKNKKDKNIEKICNYKIEYHKLMKHFILNNKIKIIKYFLSSLKYWITYDFKKIFIFLLSIFIPKFFLKKILFFYKKNK